MSSIPADAMPKARSTDSDASAGAGTDAGQASPGLARRAADLVRDNPKTAIAAGAAVVAAGAAAAAIPLVRGRRRSGGGKSGGGNSGGGNSGGGKSSGGKAKRG